MIQKNIFKCGFLLILFTSKITYSATKLTTISAQVFTIAAAGTWYYMLYKTGGYIGKVILNIKRKYRDYKREKNLENIKEKLQELFSVAGIVFDSTMTSEETIKLLKNLLVQNVLIKNQTDQTIDNIANIMDRVQNSLNATLKKQEATLEHLKSFNHSLQNSKENFSDYFEQKTSKKNLEKTLYDQYNAQVHDVNDTTIIDTKILVSEIKDTLQKSDNLLDTIILSNSNDNETKLENN